MQLHWPDLLVEIGRIFRFGIVGIAATVTYACATFAAVEWFAFSPVIASILGQLIAGGVSYFGHALYSFRVRSDNGVFRRRFVVIAIVTFATNGLVTWLLTDVMGVSYRISIAIVTVLIPITNYLANRLWVFQPGMARLVPLDRLGRAADVAGE